MIYRRIRVVASLRFSIVTLTTTSPPKSRFPSSSAPPKFVGDILNLRSIARYRILIRVPREQAWRSSLDPPSCKCVYFCPLAGNRLENEIGLRFSDSPPRVDVILDPTPRCHSRSIDRYSFLDHRSRRRRSRLIEKVPRKLDLSASKLDFRANISYTDTGLRSLVQQIGSAVAKLEESNLNYDALRSPHHRGSKTRGMWPLGLNYF